MKRPVLHIDPDSAELKPGNLSRAIGATPRVTSDLITVCLGEASIVGASGRGSRRVLSVKDGATVAVGKKFRDYGFSPGRVRCICDFMKEHWDDALPTRFQATPAQVIVGSDKGYSLKVSAKDLDEKWLLVGDKNVFWMEDLEKYRGPSGKPRPEYVYLRLFNKEDLGKALDSVARHPVIVMNLTSFVMDFVGRILLQCASQWNKRVR